MADQDPNTFPNKIDQARINQYALYDKVYAGDHYGAFSAKVDKEFVKRYDNLRFIVANFAGLVSRIMADMLFGEPITIDCQNSNNQKFVDSLIEDNALITQLYESALANSRRGDSVFKIRIGRRNVEDTAAEPTLIIEEVNPSFYFPEFDMQNARYTPKRDVLAWEFERGQVVYIHFEYHRPGFIEHEIYSYDRKTNKLLAKQDVGSFGFEEIEETGVDRSLVFHIPNVRDGSGFYGTSDYQDLMSLFFALDNRITKIDNILDKHSDPILAVPPGVIDEDGKVRKEALGMFEVDNETGAKPEYIVWNANLESGFKEIDVIIDMLFMFSEISPAASAKDGAGQAESGRALKFKLLSTIRKRNRKIRYYDQAVKDMLETAMALAKKHGVKLDGLAPAEPERPTIQWGDGVINDETEMTDIAIKRIDAGISSKADAIAALDNMTPDEAKKKVKEIEDESAVDLPLGNTPPEMAQPPTPKPVPQPPAGT